MKTQGKIPVAKSDFTIVGERLANGRNRLQRLQRSHQLSEDQQTALASVMNKLDLLQEAAMECNKADSLSLPGARRKAIGETIAHFDLDNIDFGSECGAFGLMERFEESRANAIDRDLEVENLVAGIHGFDTEAQYQGASLY